MSTDAPTLQDEIAEAQKAMREAHSRLTELKRKVTPEPVEDYTLKGSDGQPVTLSALFGDKSELLLIHNMGKGCVYCTLWADGFNGIAPHLMDRAAFVLVSPDAPDVQAAFAESRGWRFPMASAEGSTFTKDMGFQQDDGAYWPGVSVFRKKGDGSLERVNRDTFGPGDLYCSMFHFMDLLPETDTRWGPKFTYET